MSAKKLHRWYQQVLSGFTQAQQDGEIGKDDLEFTQQGEVSRIAVPILEQKHLGAQMAIDEKTINGICYTKMNNYIVQ